MDNKICKQIVCHGREQNKDNFYIHQMRNIITIYYEMYISKLK